jgi:hypothetical protein
MIFTMLGLVAAFGAGLLCALGAFWWALLTACVAVMLVWLETEGQRILEDLLDDAFGARAVPLDRTGCGRKDCLYCGKSGFDHDAL